MNHHNLQLLLSSFVDGELSSHEREEVQQHVEHCAECQRMRAEFQQIRSEIHRTGNVELPPSFTTMVLRTVRQLDDPQTMWTGVELLARRLVFALTLVVFFIVSVSSLNKPEQQIVMESYLSGESADSTTHAVLTLGEVSKEDLLLAVLTR